MGGGKQDASIDPLIMTVNHKLHTYPFCIVWTPIPLLTWMFPYIGHMGIATSKGIIRDFAGSYYVSDNVSIEFGGSGFSFEENNMGFGWPTLYWQLDPANVPGGIEAYDRAVKEASDEYKTHAHNLFCDNCHSHVALALNKMRYNGLDNYNMANLTYSILVKGSFVGGSVMVYMTCSLFLLLVVKNFWIFKMVRLTIDLIENSPQYVNTLRDRELSLRACKIPVLENVGATMDKFDTIDFTDNDIRKLENIPLLKRLSCLLLHNNRVQQIMPNLGGVLPSLRTLALTNNNLCELGDIDPLATCKKLEYLTLIGNPVTHKPQYRSYVIYRVPSVRVLDFKRVRLSERQEAAKLFKGKEGRKLREQVVKTSAALPDDESGFGSRRLQDEDARKIQAAIESASSIAEVEYLQNILQSGRIPEKGWQFSGAQKEHDSQRDGDEEFVVENENEEAENGEVQFVENGTAPVVNGEDIAESAESLETESAPMEV
ncbi:unnamed protein product [Enterobius vermicularis]|uniref:Probable U2 small nuclear ribonucleoprotein A' n=1 Tax=Enterobius vermicularis TaxID=51028 RepID=A0A0N4V0J0_ENTVE|nr:unnamed protein product [Enterobius vermicularis]